MAPKTTKAEQAAELPPVTMDELLKIVDRHFIEKARVHERNQRYRDKHRDQILEYKAKQREQPEARRLAAYQAEQTAKAERAAAGIPEPEPEPVKSRMGRPRKLYVPPVEATGDHEQS